MLLRALRDAHLPPNARVLDLCTGSGVLAIGAAAQGAGEVVALDLSEAAVRCAQRNAVAAGARVDVEQGGLPEALVEGPFDVVLCNPPYVPTEPGVDYALAWDAGVDGRLLLDPLCRHASRLLNDGGFMLLVHSACSGPEKSLRTLRENGLKAAVVARTTIPFGPVMAARAGWLESVGMIEPGSRHEELVVIRGDRADSDGP